MTNKIFLFILILSAISCGKSKVITSRPILEKATISKEYIPARNVLTVGMNSDLEMCLKEKKDPEEYNVYVKCQHTKEVFDNKFFYDKLIEGQFIEISYTTSILIIYKQSENASEEQWVVDTVHELPYGHDYSNIFKK